MKKLNCEGVKIDPDVLESCLMSGSVLTLLSLYFLLLELCYANTFYENRFYLLRVAVSHRYWPFSVILVVLMLSLKLKQDGPHKTEVY